MEANGGPQPRFSFPEHTPPRCPCQGNTGPASAGVAWVPDGRPGLTGGRRVAPSLTPLWKVKPGAGRRWRCRCRARAVTKSVPHRLIAPQGLSASTVHSSGSRCRRLGLTRSAVGTAVPLHPEGRGARGAPERSSWRGDLLAAVQAGALPGGRGPWGLLALRPRPAVCTGHGVVGAPQAGLGSEALGRGAAAVWAAACVRSPRRVGWRAGSVAGGGFAARLVKGQGTAP